MDHPLPKTMPGTMTPLLATKQLAFFDLSFPKEAQVKMEKYSFTQAEIHKTTSFSYCVNFISASIILFPFTGL